MYWHEFKEGPPRWLWCWSTCCTRWCWETLGFLMWRKEGFGCILLVCINSRWGEEIENIITDLFYFGGIHWQNERQWNRLKWLNLFFFFPPNCESCLERLCWFYLCKVWLDSDYSNLLQLILLWTGWLKVVQVSRGAFLLPPAAVLWSSAFCRLYQFTGWG